MDYSKYAKNIIADYTIFALSIFIVFVLLICAEIYLIKTFCKDMINLKRSQKHFFGSKECIISFVGMAFITIFICVIIVFSTKIIADIPYIINDDFHMMQGAVISQDSAGSDDLFDSRAVELQNLETGESGRFHFYYTPIKNGEVYEVMYLPHTKIGAIIRKIE